MTIFRNLKKYWYLYLFLSFSIICFISVWIPPSEFWPAVFTGLAIPAILIVNVLLFLFLFFYQRKVIIFPIIGLLAGMPFLPLTFSFHTANEVSSSDLSVLGFNAKLFRRPNSYSRFSFDMINWAAADSSDVKCFQEYSTNSKWPVLDVTKLISDHGYEVFAFAADIEDADHNPGLAIFSKFPIIDSGYVWKKEGSYNGGIYADILYKSDTVRIYNVHLASMNLELYQYRQVSRNYLSKIRRLIGRLKYGAEARSYQLNRIIEHTNQCPYPFIISGDFNETPYSYVYFKMRALFSNTFEEVGNGFGFTFNSMLFFLRIDHQFHSKAFEATEFRVDRSMKLSDHFPLRGFYRLRN